MRYALRNIRRLKAKSILSFAIAFAVLFLSMFSVLVIRMSEDNRERFYGPLDGAFHVTDDNLQPYLTYDAAMALKRDTDCITKVSAVRKTTAYLSTTEYVGYGTFKRPTYGGEDYDENFESVWLRGTRLCGVTSMDILQEVYSGDLVMTEGTMIREEDTEKHHNKAVISKEFAEKNNLHLGDSLPIYKYSIYFEEKDREDDYDLRYAYNYTVGGIYENRMETVGFVPYPWLLSSNQIYVPITTFTDISHMEDIDEAYHKMPISIEGVAGGKPIYIGGKALFEDPAIVPDSLYFHLSDKKLAGQLTEEINSIGMQKPVVLTEYVSNASTSPSVRLSEMMTVLLVGIVAVGFAVFLFALLFNLKSRHRELAVLAALGKKRSRISGSFFLEICTVTVAAFLLDIGVLALAIALFATPFTKYLYSAEISAKFTNETVNSVMQEEDLQQFITDDMGGFADIFGKYGVPATVTSCIIMVLLMAVVYLFIATYVRKINALSGVGGKE